MRNQSSEASIIKTLEYMINNPEFKTARDIGLGTEPIFSLNTIIKNISFLRLEYGDGLIKDDGGKVAPESDEFRYKYNKKHLLLNQFCGDIKNKNRAKLNLLLNGHKRHSEEVKIIAMQEAGWKQESTPCVCGSWYSKKGKCNNVKCGKER